MARVAVVTDSTADIPPELIKWHGIHVVPLNVRMADTVYEDRMTITPGQFVQRLVESGEFPTTSQPPVGRFQQLYRELAADHDAIISIHLSSRLSGTIQSARLAREALGSPTPIVILDSRLASMGLGFPVLQAARLALEGYPLDVIEHTTRRAIEATHVMFYVDTLEYLRRGGRIGRAAEIIGSLLQLKPILRMEEGIVVPFARTRTRPRALAGLIDLVREFPRIDQIAILSTGQPGDAEHLTDALSDICDTSRMVVSEFSPVLTTHLGPGAVGVVVYEGEGLEKRS